jgi:hypothetical protein
MYQENPETGFQEIPENENPGIYNTDEKQTLENMVANLNQNSNAYQNLLSNPNGYFFWETKIF